jgi:hypothetical protein
MASSRLGIDIHFCATLVQKRKLTCFARPAGPSWRVDDLCEDPRRVGLPVPRCGWRGRDRGLSREWPSRCRCGQSVLPQSDQEPGIDPTDYYLGRLRGIASRRARYEDKWPATSGHDGALIEVSEQPDRIGSPWRETSNRSNAWLQRVHEAAVTRQRFGAIRRESGIGHRRPKGRLLNDSRAAMLSNRP